MHLGNIEHCIVIAWFGQQLPICCFCVYSLYKMVLHYWLCVILVSWLVTGKSKHSRFFSHNIRDTQIMFFKLPKILFLNSHDCFPLLSRNQAIIPNEKCIYSTRKQSSNSIIHMRIIMNEVVTCTGGVEFAWIFLFLLNWLKSDCVVARNWSKMLTAAQ